MAKKKIPKTVKKKVMRYRKRYYKKKGVKAMFKINLHLPFGQSQKINHRYLENIQLVTNLGNPAIYSFRLNSLYDPNYTGAGHQPIGFDQLTPIFNSYTVIGARANIKVWNRNASEFQGWGAYLSEDSNALAPNGIQGMLEQGALKYVILPPGGTGSNPQVRNISFRVSMKKFLKVSNIMDAEELRGSATTNPNRVLYLHVIMWQPDGGATNIGGSFYLTLDQLSVWNRPINVPQS